MNIDKKYRNVRIKPSNKPYSGKLLVRMPIKTHTAVATMAEVNGKSINQWIVETLEQATA